MNHQFIPLPHQFHRATHRSSKNRQQSHLNQQSQATRLAQNRAVRVAIQRERPEKHTRRPDDIVPPQEDVHACSDVRNLQSGLGPGKGDLEDLARVESSYKLLVEEARLNKREQGKDARDQVGDDCVAEGEGVDCAEGTEGCATALDVLVVADEGGEEEMRDGGEEGDVNGPGLPNGDEDLFKVGGHGFAKWEDQECAGDEEADEEDVGDGVEHGAGDADVFCVWSSGRDRGHQLQTGIERCREGECQCLSKETEDEWAVRLTKVSICTFQENVILHTTQQWSRHSLSAMTQASAKSRPIQTCLRIRESAQSRWDGFRQSSARRTPSTR